MMAVLDRYIVEHRPDVAIIAGTFDRKAFSREFTEWAIRRGYFPIVGAAEDP